MKINDSIKKTPELTIVQTPARPNSGSAKIEQTASDSVKLSSQLQELEGKISASSVFDANKVEEIKKAIADGRFQVNSEKVADALLSSVRDMLHAQKP